MSAARMTRFAFAAAVVVSLGLAPTTRAADTAYDRMPSSYAALMKMRPMEVMHMMDAGKKGYVSKDEYMKFHEMLFDKMDKDKDGQLSRAEWEGRH
jgi:hypothetical protein